MHSERAPFFLKLAAWGGVVFLHFPILIIAAYALRDPLIISPKRNHV